MLVGYVSNLGYVALDDVRVEYQQNGHCVAVVSSTPRGAIYAEIVPGEYTVTLVKDGCGPKSVKMHALEGMPYQFRLLSETIYGYMWPKWVKSGERSEFRVYSMEAYKLSLWRYGLEKEYIKPLGWFDEGGFKFEVQRVDDDAEKSQRSQA